MGPSTDGTGKWEVQEVRTMAVAGAF
jgi:hypothetical protein